MWASVSTLLIVSIVVVIGIVFQLIHDFSISTENIPKNAKIPFKLMEEPISGPIVVPNKCKGEKGYLLPHCQSPLHHGVQKCTKSSSLRFFMDADTETCLAFKYSGCGGNSNNFESWSSCMSCFAADYSGCPAGSTRVRNTDNSTICATMENEDCTGPNSYCSRGAFFGQCCDKTTRDKVYSDENGKEGCGPGQKKVSTSTGSFQVTLLGKSCNSNFCPQKSTCHQGNFFAYCCSA